MDEFRAQCEYGARQERALAENSPALFKLAAPQVAKREWGYDGRLRRAICVLLILLAHLGVAGCCPPWTEAPFETAYSAVGAQVK